MKQELANLLQSYDPTMTMEVRNDYSGRGMFGKETAAIVTDDSAAILQTVVSIAKEDPEALEEFQEDDFRFRQDSLGRDSIIYY
ncbi:hypothetical protein P4B35_23295 [Pontiellaceae bacterium B12227]|nr:hypothetical protein [Pontiellaceae bacterium B12227]